MGHRPAIFELRQIIYSFLSKQQFSTSTRVLTRPLRVLGLESSADDTCASIVSSDGKILSNVVLKQDMESFGGIHPMYAMESHQKFMPVAIQRALKEAGNLSLKDLDAIAFTRGPGMFGCLSVCSGAAKALAAATGLPLIGVHHMQGVLLFHSIICSTKFLIFDILKLAHALTPFLTEKIPPTFPFLTLLVSGGHSLLLLAQSESKFKILATTADESIGCVSVSFFSRFDSSR